MAFLIITGPSNSVTARILVKSTIVIFALLCMVGCAEKESTTAEKITAYYEGFQKSDYEQIKQMIADSLTMVEGDYTTAFTPESYYEQFKWDSVFKPVYKMVTLEKQGEQVMAKVAVNSLRYEFLKNDPLICSHKFYFTSGKISKIENLDCIDADWAVWEKERDSLVSWVKLHHPELDGFIHDLSMKGAVNYLKAIELYQKR